MPRRFRRRLYRHDVHVRHQQQRFQSLVFPRPGVEQTIAADGFLVEALAQPWKRSVDKRMQLEKFIQV